MLNFLPRNCHIMLLKMLLSVYKVTRHSFSQRFSQFSWDWIVIQIIKENPNNRVLTSSIKQEKRPAKISREMFECHSQSHIIKNKSDQSHKINEEHTRLIAWLQGQDHIPTKTYLIYMWLTFAVIVLLCTVLQE